MLTCVRHRWVLGLSLGSDVTMLFHPPADAAVPAAAPVAVRLPARSLYVLTGDARWTYRHEIVRSTTDCLDGEAVPRRYRASVTWRGISEAWLPRALADAQNDREAAC
jgi:alkylated DNA repair dioxygenase AlkB